MSVGLCRMSYLACEERLSAINSIFIVTMTQFQKLTACTWWPNPVENRDEGLDHKTSANF